MPGTLLLRSALACHAKASLPSRPTEQDARQEAAGRLAGFHAAIAASRLPFREGARHRASRHHLRAWTAAPTAKPSPAKKHQDKDGQHYGVLQLPQHGQSPNWRPCPRPQPHVEVRIKSDHSGAESGATNVADMLRGGHRTAIFFARRKRVLIWA